MGHKCKPLFGPSLIVVGHCLYGGCQHREKEHRRPVSQWNSDHYPTCQGYLSCDAHSYVSTSSLRLSVGTGHMIFSHLSGDSPIQTVVHLMIPISMTLNLHLLHPVHSQTTKHHSPTNEVSEINLISLRRVRRRTRKDRLKTRLLAVLLARRRARKLRLLPRLETQGQRAMTKPNVIAAKMGITKKSSATK